ncbi:PREDICTED: pentatricopeptide repeat-containing protein At5g55740, chloroplastic-like [Nelumbo nucifera]|uniref:Pentatricopeptide repeat-containing protein At5g55740, chloroplastic-like n=2 Tax=Nelumbo nucifera TaxID=4432 RepID=A0A1U8A8L0_NELNU|nr:PREDICTED: pentatricopeptide repeat-containing protein At5g55740, chloroplastic-like [Nelumbo nucifera]DAD19111.1 TPA_asm: hypothetical protein HUJ06_020574 [Nelumbo nucifera]
MASAILKTPRNPLYLQTHHGSPHRILKPTGKGELFPNIVRLCSENRLKEAVSTLDLFQKPILSPERLRMYELLISSIASVGDLSLANEVYRHMKGSDLHRGCYLGTKIIGMFIKCGSLDAALQVFDAVNDKNLHTWSVILTGFCRNGQFDDALHLVRDFSGTHVRADGFVLSNIVKACAGSCNFRLGREVHGFAYRSGYESDIFVNNCLLDAYRKWGRIDDARKLFDRMYLRDIASWNSMLKGYSDAGEFPAFIRLIEEMKAVEGLKLNLITWNTMISGYAAHGCSKEALNCFCKMQSMGMKPDLISCNALISALARDGYFQEVLELIQQMKIVGLEPDIISWTTLIGGYVNSGYFAEALNLFSEIQSSGLVLDKFMYSLSLKACSGLQAIRQGREIHGHMIRNGFSNGTFLSTSLVNMYAKCGRLDCAKPLLSKNDIVSWNSLISGYIKNGDIKEAKELLQQLQAEPLKLDLVSWNLMINCYVEEGDMNGALGIVDLMQSFGLLPDSFSWNSLLKGYAKAGQLSDAVELLGQTEFARCKQDSCSWNTLISTHVKNGKGVKALQAFRFMRIREFEVDPITISCILRACALLGALRIGKSIHGWIIRRKTQDKYVTSALLEMYIKSNALDSAQKLFAVTAKTNLVLWNGMISGLAKCGQMHEAYKLFHEMRSTNLSPDVVSWTSIMLGYIKCGNADLALEVWTQMLQAGVQPDPISLIAASTACANLGMLGIAKEIHGFSITTGLEREPSVQAVLMNMYLECGSMI